MINNTHYFRIHEVIELSLSHYPYFKTIAGCCRAIDSDLYIIAVVTRVKRIKNKCSNAPKVYNAANNPSEPIALGPQEE